LGLVIEVALDPSLHLRPLKKNAAKGSHHLGIRKDV